MGYKGQLALYGYYGLCATLLRATSPPLALMTAQETALSGGWWVGVGVGGWVGGGW